MPCSEFRIMLLNWYWRSNGKIRLPLEGFWKTLQPSLRVRLQLWLWYGFCLLFWTQTTRSANLPVRETKRFVERGSLPIVYSSPGRSQYWFPTVQLLLESVFFVPLRTSLWESSNHIFLDWLMTLRERECRSRVGWKMSEILMPIRQLFSTDVVSRSTMSACPIERSTAEIN